MAIKKINFICPQCGQQGLEEVVTGLVQSSQISAYDTEVDGDNLEYGETTRTGGDVDRYQCIGCGFVLKDDEDRKIKTPGDLVKWLQQRGMIKGQKKKPNSSEKPTKVTVVVQGGNVQSVYAPSDAEIEVIDFDNPSRSVVTSDGEECPKETVEDIELKIRQAGLNG